MRTRFSIVLVFLTLLLGTACHRQVHVVNTPTGVSPASVENWYAADGLYKQIGVQTQKMTQAAIALKDQFPDQASYQKCLDALGKASQIGIQGGTYLQSVPQTWNQDVSQKVASFADQIAAQLDAAVNSGLSGVKDSPTKQALLAAIATGQAITKTTIALSGGQ